MLYVWLKQFRRAYRKVRTTKMCGSIDQVGQQMAKVLHYLLLECRKDWQKADTPLQREFLPCLRLLAALLAGRRGAARGTISGFMQKRMRLAEGSLGKRGGTLS